MSAEIKHCRVIIIGAGIAGLSAALKLHENNINDFVVLEAQPRIGGRILTVELDNNHIELGASKLNADECLVYEILNENKLLVPQSNTVSAFKSFRNDCGKQINEWLIKDLLTFLNRVNENEKSKNCGFISVNSENYMKRKFRKFIDKNNNNGILDSQTANAVYNWCLQQIKLEEIYPWNRVNCSRKFNNFYDVKGGFKTFVSLLAQRLPENSIELCKHVIKIDYMDECVKVCTEDGCEYSAEHIIITSSVGYLKQNMDKLFFPPLPSRKLKAFKSIDFKTMNKVYLQVDECLPDMQFQLIWTSKKHTNLPEWVYDIFAIEMKTNCLLFWFDGKGAEIIENEPAASLASICLNVFELFVKDVKISKAKRIIASKWKSNEYFCGAFSDGYCSLNRNSLTHSDLIAPIKKQTTIKNNYVLKPVVLFAGEATDFHYYSTINGALVSGIREAQAIIDFMSFHH